MPRHLAAAAGVALVALAAGGCSGGGQAPGPPAAASSTAVPACRAGKAPSFAGTATSYDTPARVEAGRAVAAQVSAPMFTSYPSGTPGMRVVSVQVAARVVTNGVFAISPASFVLVDRRGHACAQPQVDPLPRSFPVLQVDESHPGAGQVAFLVPAGSSLGEYTLYYTDSPGGTVAAAAWSTRGATPTVPVATTCRGAQVKLATHGAKKVLFGHAATFGDKVVSETIMVGAPRAHRTLPPGPHQPNDVDGVLVPVSVKANGALGFVSRGQFRLADDHGNLCRYNPLGSAGENLTSALIEPGRKKSYRLIFWMPRGAQIHGWRLYYVPGSKGTRAEAVWGAATNRPGPVAAPTAPQK